MILSIDSELTSLDWHHGAKPFYFSTCDETGKQHAWRWRVDPYTREVAIDRNDLDEIWSLIDKAEIIVGQNIKTEQKSLHFAGLRKPFPWHKVRDTLIAGHILASNQPHTLNAMVLDWLGDDIEPLEKELHKQVHEARRVANLKSFQEKYGELAIAKKGRADMPSAGEKPFKADYWLPYEMAELLAADEEEYRDSAHPWRWSLEAYADPDPVYALALWQVMEPELKKRGDWNRFMENMEVARITCEMESHGITRSKSRSAALYEEFKREESKYEDRCVRIARASGFELSMPKGTGVNNSLRAYMFDHMRFPVVGYTEGGQPSLDKDAMTEWLITTEGAQHDFVRNLFDKRAYSSAVKAHETYDRYSVPDPKDPDLLRLYPNINPVGTGTTRTSSDNPNGQNACVDAETELLTNKGWVRADQIEVGMSIAQYWKEDGHIDFCDDPGIVHHWFSGRMHHLTTELHIDMMLTPNHRCLLGNRKTGDVFDLEAARFKSDYKQFHAGRYIGGHISLTEWEVAWLCAVQADGSYIKVDGAEYGIRLSFHKERKIERLRECLLNLKAEYREKLEKDGSTTFTVGKYHPLVGFAKHYMPYKTFGPWLLDLDRATLDLFCNEVFKWDGDSTREAAWTSSKSVNADWVQIAQTLSGRRSTIAVRNPTGNDHYFVNITKDKDYSLTTNFNRRLVEWDGPVYCVTVPSSYILIRRNGKVSVTGNSKGRELDNDRTVPSIRKELGPGKGRVWFSLDYENLELMIPAYWTGEESMIELFEKPNDPPYFGSYHLLSASIIYPDLFWPIADIKGEFKRKYGSTWYKSLKNFNFGVQYDAGDATADAAAKRKGSKAKLLAGLPKIAAKKAETLAYARKHGIVRTLPDLSVPGDKGYPLMIGRYEDGGVKTTTPWNYVVQGTAGWAKKKAMIRVDRKLKEWFKQDKFSGKMILEIHDELVLDFPANHRLNKERILIVKSEMEKSGHDIGIPLRVSISFHPENWSDEAPFI